MFIIFAKNTNSFLCNQLSFFGRYKAVKRSTQHQLILYSPLALEPPHSVPYLRHWMKPDYPVTSFNHPIRALFQDTGVR